MPFETGRKTAPMSISAPKVYRPTMEEFSDFAKFVAKIEREDKAHEMGICKIIPPEEWVPREKGYALADLDLYIEAPIKQKFQLYDEDYPGAFQARSQTMGKCHVKDFYKKANNDVYKPPRHETYDELERKYWKSLEFKEPPIYGADVSRSFTDPELKVWNIAKLDSILKYLEKEDDTVIQGVNSPYLYFGMWRATFSWHVEDMDLYGLNMVHYGAPKTWYCVPPKYGHMLEKLAKKIFSGVASLCSNFMRHKTCIISPEILRKHNIPFNKIVQKAREIIIVFPYAYHHGFNHGFNIAEAINFATERWIEYGKRHRPCDCDKSRVKFTMDTFIKRFQPEMYDKWMRNLDIAPHPEDPPEISERVELRARNPREYAKRLEQETHERLSKGEWDPVKSDDVVLDVYQHVEFRHLEISIDPKTFEIFEGKDALENWFQRDTLDVKQLIEDGILFKADEAVLSAESKAQFEEASQNRNKKVITLTDSPVKTITLTDSPVKSVNAIKTEEKKNFENISKNYEKISDTTTRKRPSTDNGHFAVLKKNEAIYQHSDEKWKIRINEDNWTLLENQIIPQAAKDSGFLDSDMPLDQLIELGILVKLEEATRGKTEVEEKKVKIEYFQNGSNDNKSQIKNEATLDLTIDDGEDIIIL